MQKKSVVADRNSRRGVAGSLPLPLVSPTLRQTRHRFATLCGVAAIVVTALFIPTRAEAARAPATVVHPPAPYSASATGDLTDLTVIPITGGEDPLGQVITQIISSLGLPATSVANLHLVHSEANANSTGLQDGPLRSEARAANLDPLTALSVDLSSLLSQVLQVAPPDNAAPTTKQLLAITPQQSGNLLDVGVSEASALAHWAGDSACVSADEPLADATNDVAHAGVLPSPAGGIAFAGPGNGAVSVRSTLTLPTTTAFTGADPRAVHAESSTQVASVNLFNNALMIDVITPPTVTATATGIPGTATATATQPVLTINGNPVINGMDLASSLGPLFSTINTALAPLNQALSLTVSIADTSTSVSDDGTAASAHASLLTLHLGLIGTPIVDLEVLPIDATATAPAGGLDCGNPSNPIKVGKTASKNEVTPGETFNFTITFSNTATDCVLTNTSLTDVITFSGPAGSEIVGTDPPATSIDGLTVTWDKNAVGNIGPGESKPFTISIKTPANAQAGDNYDDTATATGDCGPNSYSLPFTLNDIPTIVSGVLARTGGDAFLPTIGFFALAAALLGFRRLRRI